MEYDSVETLTIKFSGATVFLCLMLLVSRKSYLFFFFHVMYAGDMNQDISITQYDFKEDELHLDDYKFWVDHNLELCCFINVF